MQNFKISILSFLAIFIIASCFNAEKEVDESSVDPTAAHLGDVNFQVTGAVDAQPYFEKGLLLLHSFEYEDARDEFLKVQEIDPKFAMAYWGEAMTYNHSLWQRQEQEKAVAALEKLAPTTSERMALIQTDLEKDFFSAVELLFGEGTKYDRDVAYKNFMEELTKKYPDNHEVSAFYAISLLGSSRNGRDEELYGKSARIAQSIVKENPVHPGALHYLIHSYDDPEHAHLAKAAADNYSKVAPDAAHALHMPSHIYVALGKWDEVVTSNIASWNASIKRLQRKEITDKGGSYHAYNWLQYGFLQRGETQAASDLLNKMLEYTSTDSTKKAKSYLLAMKGAHMVETNTWDGEVAKIEFGVKNLPITKRAGYAFLEGMKAYHGKDIESLKSIISEMESDRIVTSNLVSPQGFAMCSAAGFAYKPPSQLDVDMAKIMEMELKAYAATLSGNTKIAAEIFEEAITLDATLNYSFGPPLILKPVQEAYGEWLLERDQTEKALAIFEKSLDRYPRRLLSLKGKKQAAEILENTNVLAEVEKELELSLSKKVRAVIL